MKCKKCGYVYDKGLGIANNECLGEPFKPEQSLDATLNMIYIYVCPKCGGQGKVE